MKGTIFVERKTQPAVPSNIGATRHFPVKRAALLKASSIILFAQYHGGAIICVRRDTVVRTVTRLVQRTAKVARLGMAPAMHGDLEAAGIWALGDGAFCAPRY
jgi:hypothetical protein